LKNYPAARVGVSGVFMMLLPKIAAAQAALDNITGEGSAAFFHTIPVSWP